MEKQIEHFLDEEENQYSLRPQELSEFIGQEKNKEKLRIHIEAAGQRNQALEHVLLVGPPGLGKTTLAKLFPTKCQAGLSRQLDHQ